MSIFDRNISGRNLLRSQLEIMIIILEFLVSIDNAQLVNKKNFLIYECNKPEFGGD